MPVEFEFVLASASPRRAELLTSAGFRFVVDPADVDETVVPGETAAIYVQRVAHAKATVVADRRGRDKDEVVLAADTTVVLGEAILGKPLHTGDAVRMLEQLSGRVHEVLTGVVILRGDRARSAIARTRVSFLELTSAEIAWYVASGEHEGKAGAYGIQGRAARFVDWIDGSWSNVVGLPIALVSQLLGEI
jgi:septum formation protein